MEYIKVHFGNKVVLKANRILILPILLVLFSNTLFAQRWPMPGATWTYCLTGWNGMPAGEETFKVTGDTLITGNNYDIIKHINSRKDNLIRTLYTRFVNDTVYRYVNNKEYLFFTFNLSVGDIFSTFRTAGLNSYWGDSACSSVLPLRVIEENEIELNGQILKEFVLEDTLFRHLYDTNYPEPLTYTLIERIGVVDNYQFINTLEPFADCSLPTDYGLAAVGKYTDDSFEYLFYECVGVGINNHLIPSNNISIYPNPAKSFVEVVNTANTSEKYKITLINNVGIVIHTAEILSDKQRIDLSNFEPGYYFLVLSSNKSSTKKTSFPLIIYH